MRLLRAFLLRDLLTETSYRLSFAVSLGGVVLSTLVFYFLARFVGPLPFLEAYGGDYFSYVLIGVAFGAYFGVGLTSFTRALREAQTTGTLEAMLMTPAPVTRIIIGSTVWSYLFTTLRVFIYLAVGALLLRADFSRANVLPALVTLALAVISFAALGILAAAVIMIVKRGDPITALISGAATLLGGIYFPVEVLPPVLRAAALLLPITHALTAMRLTLLAGAGWGEIRGQLLFLGLFCVSAVPLALLAFHLAVNQARRDGSLAQY